MNMELYWRVMENGRWVLKPARVREHNSYWILVEHCNVECETGEEVDTLLDIMGEDVRLEPMIDEFILQVFQV